MIVAIDGPARSGKSSVAKCVAQKLSINHFNSGSVYRAIAYKGLQLFHQRAREYVDETLAFFHNNPQYLHIFWENAEQKIAFKNQEIHSSIYTPPLSILASQFAQHEKCRDFVTLLMQNFAREHKFVVDGRDIGTIVFPHTPHKFYLVADIEERAQRELKASNMPCTQKTITECIEQLHQRDTLDKNRKIAPLKKAKDAMCIDTTSLTIVEVTDKIFYHVNSRENT